MDLARVKREIVIMVQKYKYILLVLTVGVLLLMIPGKPSIEKEMNDNDSIVPSEPDFAQQLSETLSNIHGAGKVMVMLSQEQGERIIYQTDSDYTQRDGSTDTKTQTIIIKDKDRNESGLIYQRNPPIYHGAIVIAEGASDPTVKLALIDAVSKLTGLGADRISVIKMK